MEFYDTLRAQNVIRWHIVNLGGRNQTLADHTFGVMVIALELARRLNHVFMDWDKFQGRLLEYCLFHDIHEVIEGDIPTPTKRRYGIEECDDDAPPLILAIVTVADRLEALFTLHDNATGVHAKQVLDKFGDETVEFLRNAHLNEGVFRDLDNSAYEITRCATEMVSEYLNAKRTIQWPERID